MAAPAYICSYLQTVGDGLSCRVDDSGSDSACRQLLQVYRTACGGGDGDNGGGVVTLLLAVAM